MISQSLKRASAPLLILLAGLALANCGERAKPAEAPGHAAAPDYERGPHRGRMLRDGDFALEMTIFEDGVPPEFHVYAYRKDKPLDPKQAQVSVELTRLGGKVDRFAFAPVEDYQRGGGVVHEPHSFDVKITAVERAGPIGGPMRPMKAARRFRPRRPASVGCAPKSPAPR